jgi:L-alanine-DL-glutamate epimerase-like enolase superfamily enzyme
VKLTKLRTHVLAAKVDKPIHFGAGTYDTFTATLVELETADGITGVGECIARRAPRVVDVVVRDLLWPVVEGQDPHDVARLWDAMFGLLRPWGHYRGFVFEGISGIDQALWDILAKERGAPLYRCLGGADRERVPVYGSKVYTDEPDRMAALAKDKVAAGHRAIKIQIGRSKQWGGPRADIDVARRIRDAIGPEVQMGADANSAYDANTAIAVGKELAEVDLWFLEEPVFPDDLEGYEKIKRGQPVPVAAGESEFGLIGFRELFRRGVLDVVQPDVARVGGFTAGMRLATLVEAHGLQYAPHTGFSCGVAQLASLHLAASVGSLSRLEWMWIDNPLSRCFSEDLPQPKDGVIAMPQAPGLGRELDREKLERFRVR